MRFRFQMFWFGLGCGIGWYFVCCVGAFDRHPELPWFERGVFFGSPLGFASSVIFVLIAFYYLLFGKDKDEDEDED